jgi:hypothetical protein
MTQRVAERRWPGIQRQLQSATTEAEHGVRVRISRYWVLGDSC